MSRTTLNIDDSVLRQLKRRSRKERKPLGTLVSELLARALHEAEPERPPFRWIARDLQPLVDLDDKDAIYDAMDEYDRSR